MPEVRRVTLEKTNHTENRPATTPIKLIAVRMKRAQLDQSTIDQIDKAKKGMLANHDDILTAWGNSIPCTIYARKPNVF